MNKGWDSMLPDPEVWRMVFKMLKPGGYIVVFGGTRTFHRLACQLEDVGFELRDTLMWVYGSGYPKSHNVSKAIDKTLGAEREKVRVKPRPDTSGTMCGSTDTRPWIEKSREVGYHEVAGDEPVTDEAKQWRGWGTALKPAYEPIILARRPLEGSVANNVMKHGVGGLNIDACRVGDEVMAVTRSDGQVVSGNRAMSGGNTGRIQAGEAVGRWPSNVLHDGSDEVLGAFARCVDHKKSVVKNRRRETTDDAPPNYLIRRDMVVDASDARFFYSAKADRDERDKGMGKAPLKAAGGMQGRHDGTLAGGVVMGKNDHPTVKPVALMRWLVKLVCPEGGLILDPFAGSGSTGVAAVREGRRCLLVESHAPYFEIIKARVGNEVKG